MSLPVFITLDTSNQLAELKSFFNSHGASLPKDVENDSREVKIRILVESINTIAPKVNNEADIESILNSLVSLILVTPADKIAELIDLFCRNVSTVNTNDKKNMARFRSLNNLFHGLDVKSPHRCNAYKALVQLAGQAGLMHFVPIDVDEIKRWLIQWNLANDNVQAFWRTLHQSLVQAKHSEKASKVMLELLATYSEDSAHKARDDTQKCIVTCISDPNTFLMDHLLSLKPVRALEGEPIHNLLTIFVSGTYSQYMRFYEKNSQFVNSLGLSHDENIRKIRLLTFLQLAENRTELSFDVLEKDLQLGQNDVEGFIIDVIRSNTARVRIDQPRKKVIVCSTTQRTFGRMQWQALKDDLVKWRQNLNAVVSSLDSVAQS